MPSRSPKVLRITDHLEGGTVNARDEDGAPAFLGLGVSSSGTTVAGTYPGTPAAGAGITAGETVTRVGTTRVRTSAALRSAIPAHLSGDQ